MSLHQLAQHVQKAGRNEDTVLIHMTPKEVHGLQSLAMAHGGSLTINPETGLPEANFLRNILPTLLGVGLSFVPGVGPLMAAGLVGGGTALATGSLNKGLMAGLGAYGGAGLGAGLSSVGAAATPASVIPGMTAAPSAGASLFGNSTLGAGIGGAQAANAASSAMSMAPGVAAPITASGALGTATVPTLANMGTGLGTLNSTAGFSNLYNALPKYTLPALGLTAAAAMQPEFKTQKQDQGMIRPYEFSRTQNMEAYDQGNPIYAEDPGSSRERNYFTDQYTALTPYKAPGPEYKKADGGLLSLNAFAMGGPIENMSAMNTMGVGEPYPQSRISAPSYASSGIQTPLGEEVLSSAADAAVDPYTGEARFAGGGFAATAGAKEPKMKGGYSYDFDPQTQQFTQTGAPTPQFSKGLIGKLMQMQYDKKMQNTPQPPMVSGGVAPQAPQQQFAQQPFAQQAPLPEYQSPEQQLGMGNFYSDLNQQMSQMRFADGGNVGGEYNLGGYSDGGRLLKGPGNGTSDSIPAIIGNRQPARLADGEFVVPARIVSEIGNGSTEAGAKALYAMMDRVQKARQKTVGKGKVAVDAKARNLLPA